MFDNLKHRMNNWMHPKEEYHSDKLYKLLFDRIDNLQTTEELESNCGLEISKRPVQVAVIQVGDEKCDPEKLHMLIDLFKEASGSDEVLPVCDNCNRVIVLFFCDTVWEDQAHDILEHTQKEFLSAWPDTRLCITLGTVENFTKTGDPAWKKSFKTAIGLQDYRYVKPKGKIIAYSEIVARREIYPNGINFHFDLLKEYLEENSPDLLRSWLSDIYSMLSGEGMDVLGLRYHLTFEIILNTVSLFREKGLSAEAYIDPPEVLINKVLSIDTPQNMQRWTEDFLDKCRKVLKQSEKD